MKYLLLLLLSFNLFSAIPNLFTTGEPIQATKMNENFQYVKPQIAIIQERYNEGDRRNIDQKVYIIPFNTLKGNTTFISIISNGFSLTPGKYLIEGFCTAQNKSEISFNFSCAIRKKGETSFLVPGSPMYTIQNQDVVISNISDIIELTTTTEFEAVISTENNMGRDNNQFIDSDILYTSLKIQKLD